MVSWRILEKIYDKKTIEKLGLDSLVNSLKGREELTQHKIKVYLKSGSAFPRIRRAGEAFNEEFIDKTLKEFLVNKDFSGIRLLLLYSEGCPRRVDPELLKGILDEAAHNCSEAEFKKIKTTASHHLDKDSIVKKAEEYLEKNEYLKAYDHFKWAQKLDEQITNNIIHDLFKQFKEGITSNENPMVLAGIAYNIIDVCYDENIKFEGLRGAAEYLKREMKVWRTDPKDFFRLLACYYLLGDEEMADKVMQEIISANKKEIHR